MIWLLALFSFSTVFAADDLQWVVENGQVTGQLHPDVRTPKGPPDDSVKIRKQKGRSDMYWEAQVWGELTVQSDVGYNTPDVLAKLKSTGKPVYECVRTKADSGYYPYSRFRPGKQL